MKHILIGILLLCLMILPSYAQETTTVESQSNNYTVTIPTQWRITAESPAQIRVTSPIGEAPFLTLDIYNPIIFDLDETFPNATQALEEAQGFFRFMFRQTIETTTINDREFAYAEVSQPPYEHAYFAVFQLADPTYYGISLFTFISETPDEVFTQVLDILTTVILIDEPDEDYSVISSNLSRTAYIASYNAERDFERLSQLRASDFIPDEGRTVTEIPEINPINGFVPIARYTTLEHMVFSGVINFAPTSTNGNERCGFVVGAQTDTDGQMISGLEFGIDSNNNVYLLDQASNNRIVPRYRSYLGMILETSELHLQLVLTDDIMWLYINGQRVYTDNEILSLDLGITGVRIIRESDDTTCTLRDVWLYDVDNVSRPGEYIACAVSGDNVNTRQGPSTEYDIIGTLTDTIWVTEQAIAEDGTRWWHLINGAWVSEVAALEANINECFALPIVGETMPRLNETCMLIPFRNDNGFFPNRRTGPSTDYPVVNPMTRRNTGIATTIDSDGNRWWQMGDTYWVREDFITFDGDCDGLTQE
ncbi:MAG: hypothetical protein WBC91_02520 [Phototrophicaceae bacterium]